MLQLTSRVLAITVVTATTILAQRPTHPGEWHDTSRAVSLLNQGVAALVDAPGFRAERRYIEWVAELHRAWGMSDSIVRSLELPVDGVISRLLAEGRLEQAMDYVRSRRPGSTVEPVVHALIDSAGPERALAFADSQKASVVGVRAVLGREHLSRDRRIAVVRSWLSSAAPTSNRYYAYEQLIRFVAATDYAVALAEADSIARHEDIELRHVLAEVAFRTGLPFADSLLGAAYQESRQVADPVRREARLRAIRQWCGNPVRTPCESFELPSLYDRTALWGNQFRSALTTGGLDSAVAVAERLTRDTTEGAIVLSSFRGTASLYCPTPLCSTGLEEWRRRTVARAIALLPSTSSPSLSDQLRYHAGVHLALADPDSAFVLVQRISSDSLRGVAWAQLAHDLVEVNIPIARRAFALAGDDYRRGQAAAKLYPLLLQMADTAAAHLAFEKMDPWMRMGAEIERARGLQIRGRLTDARAVVLGSLQHWKPSEHTFMGNSNSFGIFGQLGAVDELVEWARSREQSEDRAGAIFAIVSSFTPHEYRMRVRSPRD